LLKPVQKVLHKDLLKVKAMVGLLKGKAMEDLLKGKAMERLLKALHLL
jgi:hypothetical protein